MITDDLCTDLTNYAVMEGALGEVSAEVAREIYKENLNDHETTAILALRKGRCGDELVTAMEGFDLVTAAEAGTVGVGAMCPAIAEKTFDGGING